MRFNREWFQVIRFSVFSRQMLGYFCLSLLLSTAANVVMAEPMPKGPAADPSTSLYHFNQARHFEQEGQWEKEEAELRQAIFRAPNDYLNYIRLASLLAQFGKTNEAISNYQRALSLNPTDPMLHFSLGGLYESLGEYPSAKREYQQGLSQNPEYTYGYYNLAKVLMQSGNYNDAEGAFQRFLAKYPTHFEGQRYLANVYLVNNKPEQAARAYESLKINFPDRFNDSVNLARALTQADSPDMALEELKSAYAKEGNKADILEAMGNAHLALGQNAYAIHNYEQSLSMDPNRFPLLLKIADSYQKTQKNDMAIASLKKYLETQPDNMEIHHWYANLLIQQKEYNQALDELTMLLDKAQDPKEKYQLNKEIGYALQAKGDVPGAITRYESLVNEPEAMSDNQLRTNLAIAYHKAGQLDKAASMYESVYQKLPESTPAEKDQKQLLGNDLSNALTSIGDQDYQQQRYQEAVTAYSQASRFARSDNALPLVGLGNSHFALQELEAAKSAYEQALVRDPENILAKLYLGKVELQRQDFAAAIRQLEPVTDKAGLEDGLRREALLTLGDAYQQQGKVRDAAVNYEKAQAIVLPGAAGTAQTNNDQQINLLLTQGNLWQQLKEYDKAKAAYEKVLQQSPTNAKALYNLGIVYNELNQLPQSAHSYQEALKADPAFNESRYGLAVTYEKQQKYKDALQTYQEYVKAPNALYVPQAMERIQLIQQALNPQPKQG